MTYSAVAIALAGFLMAGPALAQVSLGGNIGLGATANAGGASGLGLGVGAGVNLSDQSVEQTGAALSAINRSDASYQAKISGTANAEAAQALKLQQRAAEEAAIKAHGLTVAQYEKIMAQAKADPALQQRIDVAAQASANAQ